MFPLIKTTKFSFHNLLSQLNLCSIKLSLQVTATDWSSWQCATLTSCLRQYRRYLSVTCDVCWNMCGAIC